MTTLFRASHLFVHDMTRLEVLDIIVKATVQLECNGNTASA